MFERTISDCSFALVGFSIDENAMKVNRQRLGGKRDLVAQLQTLLQIPIYFAIIRDKSKEISNMICCWANWTDSYYDCSEMMLIPVAEVFTTMIPKLIDVQGGLRRVFVREADVIRCDFTSIDVNSPRGDLERQVMHRLEFDKNQESNLTGHLKPNIGRLTAQTNRHSPLHHLPPELFLDIVKHALSETSLARLSPLHYRQRRTVTFSHIDSRLRTITLSSPNLWTYISITHKQSSWELAKLCYARSGQCCLRVEIMLRRSPTDMLKITGPLKAVSSRIECLTVSPTLETQPELDALIYGLDAPRLEDLTLSTGMGARVWILRQLPLAPNLAKLTINGVQVGWTPEQCQNLVSFHWSRGVEEYWHNRHVSVEHLLGTLNGVQHLQSLVLENLILRTPNDLPPVIYLPALLRFTMLVNGGITRANLLSRIDAPNLQYLHLDCRIFWSVSLGHMPPPSPQYFNKVSTLWLQNIPDDIDNPQIAEWIIRLCPNTTHLVLDNFAFLETWMSSSNYNLVDNGRPGSSLTELLRLDITRGDTYWRDGNKEILHQFLSARQKLGYPRLSILCMNLENFQPEIKPPAKEFEGTMQRLMQWVDKVEYAT